MHLKYTFQICFSSQISQQQQQQNNAQKSLTWIDVHTDTSHHRQSYPFKGPVVVSNVKKYDGELELNTL